MREMRRYILHMVVMLAALLSSCKMNSLSDYDVDHSEPITIQFDFGTVLSGLIYDENGELLDDALIPASITFSFFGTSKYAVSTTQTVDFSIEDGLQGDVTVTPGTYDVLVYTSDFYDISGLKYKQNMTSLEDFEVSLYESGESRLKSRAGSAVTTELTVSAPDPMFYCIREGFDLSAGGDAGFEMQLGVPKYRINFPATSIDLLAGGSVSAYGVKTTSNIYTGEYPHEIAGYQTDTDWMQITIDVENNCFYAEFYSLGFNEDSEVDLWLSLSSYGSTVSEFWASSKEGLDPDLMQELYDELRALPNGGEVTYGGKADMLLLLNMKEIGPTIEDWEDESVDMVL